VAAGRARSSSTPAAASWSAGELRRSREVFGPRRLPELVGELLESGTPPVPLELGE
jgi:hypothetical protein